MSRTRVTLVLLAVLLIAGGIVRSDQSIGGGEDGQLSERRGHLVIGDFAEWRSDSYPVRDIHTSGAASRLTHIEYSFGSVSPDGKCVMYPDRDYGDLHSADEAVDGVADSPMQSLAGNINQVRKLKKMYPHLTVMYSLGGWAQSTHFSTAARTEQSRREFVDSCLDLAIRGNLPLTDPGLRGGPGSAAGIFDGIDIDWEWPGSQGAAGNVVHEEDRRNYTLLLEEFRRQLDALGEQRGREYLLSVFLPAPADTIQAGFEADRIFAYVDYASIHGFDFHGTWSDHTNFPAQLYSPPDDPADPPISVDEAVSRWIRLGAPPDRLVIAVPGFGRGWRNVPGVDNGRYQPVSQPANGDLGEGVSTYADLARRPGQRFRDDEAGALWLYQGAQWWSYDDPTVMRMKGAYVRERGLAGIVLWSLDQDDDDASLIRAIHSGLRRPQEAAD